jgi:hypothetical protein
MIWHEDVSAKRELQSLAQAFEYLYDDWELSRR